MNVKTLLVEIAVDVESVTLYAGYVTAMIVLVTVFTVAEKLEQLISRLRR